MKDRLEKIIKDYDLSRKACNCPMIIPTDTLCDDCVEGLSQKLIDSGYVHIDDVLECLPKEEQITKGDGWSHENTVTYGRNNALKEVRQALENLGKH